MASQNDPLKDSPEVVEVKEEDPDNDKKQNRDAMDVQFGMTAGGMTTGLDATQETRNEGAAPPPDVTAGRLQDKGQDSADGVPPPLTLGTTAILPNGAQAPPPANSTIPLCEPAGVAVVQHIVAPPLLPYGFRRVPCKARIVPEDHRPDNAFFVLPEDAEHGYPLECSHPRCEKNKFRYCKVCDVPVARRNFPRRHGHNIFHRGSKFLRTMSAGGLVMGVENDDDDDNGEDDGDDDVMDQDGDAGAVGETSQRKLVKQMAVGGTKQEAQAVHENRNANSLSSMSLDKIKGRLDVPLTSSARARRKSGLSVGSHDGTITGGNQSAYSANSINTEPGTKEAWKRAMSRPPVHNNEFGDEKQFELQEQTRKRPLGLTEPELHAAAVGRRMSNKAAQRRKASRDFLRARLSGGSGYGSSASALFSKMRNKLGDPEDDRPRRLMPMSASDDSNLGGSRGRMQSSQSSLRSSLKDGQTVTIKEPKSSLKRGGFLGSSSQSDGTGPTAKSSIQDWEMETSDYDIDDDMDGTFDDDEEDEVADERRRLDHERARLGRQKERRRADTNRRSLSRERRQQWQENEDSGRRMARSGSRYVGSRHEEMEPNYRALVDDVIGSHITSSSSSDGRREVLLTPRQRRWLKLLDECPDPRDTSGMRAWLDGIVTFAKSSNKNQGIKVEYEDDMLDCDDDDDYDEYEEAPVANERHKMKVSAEKVHRNALSRSANAGDHRTSALSAAESRNALARQVSATDSRNGSTRAAGATDPRNTAARAPTPADSMKFRRERAQDANGSGRKQWSQSAAAVTAAPSRPARNAPSSLPPNHDANLELLAAAVASGAAEASRSAALNQLRQQVEKEDDVVVVGQPAHALMQANHHEQQQQQENAQPGCVPMEVPSSVAAAALATTLRQRHVLELLAGARGVDS